MNDQALAFKVESKPGVCVAYGCCRKARSLGMCERHYKAFRRGRLLAIARRDEAAKSQAMRAMWRRIHGEQAA